MLKRYGEKAPLAPPGIEMLLRWVSRRKSCTAVVDKGFKIGPGFVSRWWWDGADIDP